MNKVLFISPTTYSDPVTKDIQIKFKSLSKVCNPIVFAFSDKKSTTVIEGVETIFIKNSLDTLYNCRRFFVTKCKDYRIANF